MSSFIGHALTAGAVFICSPKEGRSGPSVRKMAWLGCLIVAATAPDLDYFIPWLNKNLHDGLRVSHSIAFSLLIPAVVIVFLFVLGRRGRSLWLPSFQISLAGLSHVVLDYCVGVHPLPLFWPLYEAAFSSPVGILPSSGALDLTNYYLYRNLLIELGILVPIYVCIFLSLRKKDAGRRLAVKLGLLVVSAAFMCWAISLGR